MTIKEEFTRLICDIYPAPGRGCSLTHKKRLAFEKLYFTAYRSCLTRVMLSSDKPEKEAGEELEKLFQEFDSYFAQLEAQTEKLETASKP